MGCVSELIYACELFRGSENCNNMYVGSTINIYAMLGFVNYLREIRFASFHFIAMWLLAFLSLSLSL